MRKEKEVVKEKSTGRSKALTIVGILLCVILVPILVINVTMIIKSYTNPDEYPSFAGYNLMIVKSGSMEDAIMTGDLIVVKNASPEEIEEGDIISFYDPESNRGSVVTHRCIKKLESNGEYTFITMGDANASEDDAWSGENLIGKYVTRIPALGDVAYWLQTTPGLIVCIAVPIVLLVAYDLIMKKRFDKKKKKDTDQLLAELESLRAQQPDDGGKVEAKAVDAAEKKSEEKKTVAESESKTDDVSTAPVMSAEELEQFREFQKMKAQQEAAKKESKED